MSKRIPPLDLSWLVLENRDTPMHVGGLLTFTLPDDAPPDYLQNLAASLREQRAFQEPWNLKVSPAWRNKLLPSWVVDEDLDLDHHFRHAALPKPGGERELGVLVSELHSIPLDLSRPLWELHLIEGLAPNRFALYLKIHHAIIDGITVMRLLMGQLSDSAEVTDVRAIWTYGSASPTDGQAKGGGFAPIGLIRAATGVVGALARPLLEDNLVGAYTAPHSPLNGPMNGQRRFATHQLPLADVKAAAKTSGGTINDMVLWLCSTVLRKYLDENGALPDKRMTALVPVNLRDPGDFSTGTNIGNLLTDLATETSDPQERLDRIMVSSRAAKSSMERMPRESRYPYMLLATSMNAFGALTRLDALMPPMFSLVVSNVPGPRDAQYLRGSRLEAVYPISLLTRGGALNITVVSVEETLNFGFVGARDTLPHMQRMSVHLDEAMAELTELIGSGKPAPRAGRTQRGRSHSASTAQS